MRRDKKLEREELKEKELSKEEEKWYCIECGEIVKGDPRVEAEMKCSRCAYFF